MALRCLPRCLFRESLAHEGRGCLRRCGWQGGHSWCGKLSLSTPEAFGTLLKRLDDFEKCLRVFPQVQLFLPL